MAVWRQAFSAIFQGALNFRKGEELTFAATGRLATLRRFQSFAGPLSNREVRPKPDLHDLASGWSDRLKPAIRIWLTPLRQSPAQSACRAASWPL